MALHHELCGDAGVIRAGHPQRGIALHAVIADHQILHANEHGVTEVQFAGHIRRWDGDDERLDGRIEVWLVGIVMRLEVTARFPHGINARFSVFEIVGFRQFVFGHSAPLGEAASCHYRPLRSQGGSEQPCS